MNERRGHTVMKNQVIEVNGVAVTITQRRGDDMI